jgi:hypothetical protein
MRGIEIRLVPDVARRASGSLSDAWIEDNPNATRRVAMVQEGACTGLMSVMYKAPRLLIDNCWVGVEPKRLNGTNLLRTGRKGMIGCEMTTYHLATISGPSLSAHLERLASGGDTKAK